MKRINRQAAEWEKIFANHIPDKELVSRIYNMLSKLNSGKAINPTEKWAKDINISLTRIYRWQTST